MKMKKILIGISVFAITASLFSGCASQTPVETSSTATSDTSSTTTAETSSTTATEPTTESEAPVSSAESESKAETIEASTVETPATEETIGINEDEVRAHGKEWYAKYKEKVVCDEQTFVDHFVDLVIIGGNTEQEAAFEVYTLYAKIELIEPEDGVVKPPVDDSTADIKPTQPTEQDMKPAETTKPQQTTTPKEEVDYSKAPETTKPANDYSDIKWGDPIPDNLVNVYGKKAKKAHWEETDGGKFFAVGLKYYYSVQDWAEGKEPLDMDIVDGEEKTQEWRDRDPIKWQ